jgi:DNA-binding transcriptional ArsR family regulator
MQPIHASIDSQRKLDLLAKLFRGFADPSRLALLRVLSHGEQCVSDLVAATGLSQPNASGHLACLKDCGLVTARPQGRQVFYRLADAEVGSMLLSADDVLSRHIEQIAACINYTSYQAIPERRS